MVGKKRSSSCSTGFPEGARTQDTWQASQPKSQGTAFNKCNFLSPGLTLAAALVTVWDISSVCDLSLLAPYSQPSVYAS